jgi:hypothetical protein
MNKFKLRCVCAGLLALAGTAGAADAGLDRAGLLKLADNYFAALVAHNPAGVPLAADVKIVENLKRIKTSEGMWKTASSGTTAFKIVIPDTYSQQVGGIVVMGSDKNPVQLGFRLKVVGGKIVEAEHLVQGNRGGGALSGNLQTVRPAMLLDVPFEYADSRGRLVHIAKSYYDALDNNNGYLAPFASDCERRENGMRTAPNGGSALVGLNGPPVPGAAPAAAPRPAASGAAGGGAPTPPPGTAAPGAPKLLGLQDCTQQISSGAFQYITNIEDRRVDIADEKTGLAMGFSHFKHAFTQRTFRIYNDPSRTETTMTNAPFDMPALHIYKIWGGQIHEIEALGVLGVPFNSPTGWE